MLNTVEKTKYLFAVILIFLIANLVAAAEKEVKGQLVDINPGNNSIVVDVKGKLIKYKVAEDAKWHICLQDRCAEEKGPDGFRVIEEYAQFEAYGLPMKSYYISFSSEGEKVKNLNVEIVKGKHRK